MKTQKLDELADSRLEPAIAVLSQAAESRQPDGRARERLRSVQAVLADDFVWLEQTLASAVEHGSPPATHAARHLVSNGGKRVRPMALLLSAACFGRISPAARELALVAELIHSATLLHDDVIDDASERRGARTARLIWGNGVSVLAGDLLLVHALERTQTHAPEIMPDLIRTLYRLVDGEIIQLRGRSELDVSEATYERILRDKTASLFAWATRTGARLAGASEEDQERLAGFGERLGIAFQLVDDVLDYSGENTGKTLFTDLAEGKLTLPLVVAVARRPELVAPLRRIFEGDREPVGAVSRAVVESGACDEARRRACDHTRRAVEELSAVRHGPARVLLEHVANELAARAA